MDTFNNQDRIIVIIGAIIIIIMAAIFIKGSLLPKEEKNPQYNNVVTPTTTSTTTDSGSGAVISTTSTSTDINAPILYKNEEYGFQLEMPDSWKGYSSIKDTWQGQLIDSPTTTYSGTKIIIRNQNWTENNKWQDIPVLVFTKDQWELVQEEKISLGAAPIGPGKLGENERYVFALPARWVGFTDALGQKEAEQIVKTFKVIK